MTCPRTHSWESRARTQTQGVNTDALDYFFICEEDEVKRKDSRLLNIYYRSGVLGLPPHFMLRKSWGEGHTIVLIFTNEKQA